MVEKMITLGKKGNLAAYRRAMGFVTKEDVVNKLFKEVAPQVCRPEWWLHQSDPLGTPPR